MKSRTIKDRRISLKISNGSQFQICVQMWRVKQFQIITFPRVVCRIYDFKCFLLS